MRNNLKERTEVLVNAHETDMVLGTRVSQLKSQGLHPCVADIRGGGLEPSL